MASFVTDVARIVTKLFPAKRGRTARGDETYPTIAVRLRTFSPRPGSPSIYIQKAAAMAGIC